MPHSMHDPREEDDMTIEPFLEDYPWYLVVAAGLLLVCTGYLLYRSFFSNSNHTLLGADTFDQLQRPGHEKYAYVPVPVQKESSAYRRHHERNMYLAGGGQLDPSRAFTEMPYKPVQKIRWTRTRARPTPTSRRSY